MQDTRSGDGRTSALAFLARMLVMSAPPVPPLADELPSLLAPSLKTSLAVSAPLCTHCQLHCAKSELAALDQGHAA